MNMRRIFVGTVASMLAVTLLTGFTHSKLTGGGSGGGGGGWTSIVKDARDGLTAMASATAILMEAQADLAEALKLKDVASLLRKEAATIRKSGEDTDGKTFRQSGKTSASAQVKINKKLMGSAEFDGKTAEAVKTAGKAMIPALARIGKGVVLLVKASSAASGAGTPSPTDFAAVGIAAQIPEVMPAAAESIPRVFETVTKFKEVAEQKGVEVANIPPTGFKKT
jgi:hypothetical protein